MRGSASRVSRGQGFIVKRRCRLALAGPNWEIYGHWVDEWNRDPSKIRTDVFYLIKKSD